MLRWRGSLQQSPAAQASERRQGQVWAHTQPWGPWRLTCSLVATESHHRHSKIIRGQRQTPLARGPQLKRLAPNACPSIYHCRGLGWHLALVQVQRLSWLPVQIAGSGYSQGGTVRWHLWMWKPVGGSTVVKPVGILHRAGYREPQLPLLCSWYWEPQLLSVVPACPYMSWLFQSLSRVELKWSSMLWCDKLGKLVAHLILPFPARELLWTPEFSSGAEQCCPGGWDDAGTMKLSFLFFVWRYSLFFVSRCCWNFLSGLLSPSRAILVCECLIVDICGGMEAGTILVMWFLNYDF